MVKPLEFSSTKDIKVPGRIIDQVLGQDEAIAIAKKAALQRRHILLVGEPGTGKCVGKNVVIPTSEGEWTAEELYNFLSKDAKIVEKEDGVYCNPTKEVEVFALNKEGRVIRKKIVNLYYARAKKKCLKIKSFAGAEVVVSGEHPLLTSENGEFVFKVAAEIREGEVVGVARRLPLLNKNETNISILPKIALITQKEGERFVQYRGINGVDSLVLHLPEKMNKDIAYFLGVYVAEGDYSDGLQFSNRDENIKKKIKEIAISDFAYPEQWIEIDRDGVKFKKSRTLACILECCFDQKLWDNEKRRTFVKQSHYKCVPKAVLNADETILRSFLAGYIDGDGHFDKEGLEVSSASKKLIEGLRIALLKLGILSRVKEKMKYAANTVKKTKREYYYLTVTGVENLLRLNQEIPLLKVYKKNKLVELSRKKGNTNVDLMYGVESLLGETKKLLRLDCKRYKIANQTFNRYVRGKQVPSRDYIRNFVLNLEEDLVTLRLKRDMLFMYKDYGKSLEDGIGNFYHDIKRSQGFVSHRMMQRYDQRLNKPYLKTVCLVNNIPNRTQEMYGMLRDVNECTALDLDVKITRKNSSVNVTRKLLVAFEKSRVNVNKKIVRLEEVLSKLRLIAYSDIFFDKIKKIEVCEEEVYDFEVEGVHNFITGSGIVVHNSLLGQALAELVSKEKLVDILCFHNENDENQPLIRTMPKGKGKDFVNKLKTQAATSYKGQNILFFILLIVVVITPWWVRKEYGDVMAAASLIGSMIFLASFVLFINLGRKLKPSGFRIPKLLVDNANTKTAPFLDATGAHAGALLGDCLHDPLQSGGLGTPAYERITAGMIHKANGGVLFIDEIATLQVHQQQELLTALQEKKYPITGQSERSSGAMVISEPVPADFILVAAGNLEAMKHVHPALRSRIRGYGYEVHMNETMDDTVENRNKLVQFVAQEVVKDKKIPHFTKDAVEQIILEARKMAGIAGKVTGRLRELGGLVRSAGDLALEEGAKLTTREHVLKAKKFSRPLEQQLADRYIENKKKYDVIITTGAKVGRVNGLAVIGSGAALSGLVLPIESEVSKGGNQANFVATGNLGKIAKEAIKNVSAIILKSFGEDIKENHDVYVQFLQTAAEGVEGDSASIAVATAIISALKRIPVRQDTAMTGSLSIRGEVLAIGGVTAKVEGAIETGLKQVIIPQSNEKDLVLSADQKNKIKIIPVGTIVEVLEHALVWDGKEGILRKIKEYQKNGGKKYKG